VDHLGERCALGASHANAQQLRSGGRHFTAVGAGWTKVHDNRHTLVTELSESGAGDEVIMSIAGHVSRAMLSRYSHVRMEAKRRALDEIAARQRAADEKRKEASQKVVAEGQALAGTPRLQ
jgi:integrase